MNVTLNPITEIKITDLVHSTIENITKDRAINSQPLVWIDGILFFVIPYDNEDLRQKQTEGILFLDSVFYTECPKKIEESKVNGFNVDVLDGTGVATLEGLVDAIKGVIYNEPNCFESLTT